MSSRLRIGIVAEGKTDFIILEQIIYALLNGRSCQIRQLQPPESDYAGNHGPLGGGWKAVLNWCEMHAKTNLVTLRALFDNLELLVIHVDAEVTREREMARHDLTRPCPPGSASADALRVHLLSTLGLTEHDRRIIFCLPCQTTEAWIFAALFPNDVAQYHPLECRHKPETLLVQKAPYRLVSGDGKKDKDAYRKFGRQIALGFVAHTTGKLGDAAQFSSELASALAAAGTDT